MSDLLVSRKVLDYLDDKDYDSCKVLVLARYLDINDSKIDKYMSEARYALNYDRGPVTRALDLVKFLENTRDLLQTYLVRKFPSPTAEDVDYLSVILAVDLIYRSNMRLPFIPSSLYGRIPRRLRRGLIRMLVAFYRSKL